jgi:hypothetical protein
MQIENEEARDKICSFGYAATLRSINDSYIYMLQ